MFSPRLPSAKDRTESVLRGLPLAGSLQIRDFLGDGYTSTYVKRCRAHRGWIHCVQRGQVCATTHVHVHTHTLAHKERKALHLGAEIVRKGWPCVLCHRW